DGTLARATDQPSPSMVTPDTPEAADQPTGTERNPFPIPGFPTIPGEEGGDVRALGEGEYEAAEEVGLEWTGTVPAGEKAVTSLEGSTGMPRIRSMALNIILEDGVTPQIIENVRQVALIAARFDRDRGDVLSITTAAFKAGSRPSAGRSASGQDYDTPQTEELRSQLEEAKERNAALMQELRDRELEYLQRSEDERKQALADLAAVQNERSKDLIYLQQQREEQNARMQDALLNEISELRREMTSGGLSEEEQDIKSIQATSLEDSLEVIRAGFEQEKARLQAQIESAMNQSDRARGLGGDGQGTLILVVVIFLSALIIGAVIYFTSRDRTLTGATAYAGRRPTAYPRGRPARPRPGRKPRKKPAAKTSAPAESEAKAAAPATEVDQALIPSHVEDDPEVLRSELKSIRQSVVSMSVGRQETASQIINDWLQSGEGGQGSGPSFADEDESKGESESTGEEGF
ncbi:MAG: hypothetical protein V3W14_03395, partial [Candidatus Neomarinimicrobiota bacterium]